MYQYKFSRAQARKERSIKIEIVPIQDGYLAINRKKDSVYKIKWYPVTGYRCECPDYP